MANYISLSKHCYRLFTVGTSNLGMEIITFGYVEQSVYVYMIILSGKFVNEISIVLKFGNRIWFRFFYFCNNNLLKIYLSLIEYVTNINTLYNQKTILRKNQKIIKLRSKVNFPSLGKKIRWLDGSKLSTKKTSQHRSIHWKNSNQNFNDPNNKKTKKTWKVQWEYRRSKSWRFAGESAKRNNPPGWKPVKIIKWFRTGIRILLYNSAVARFHKPSTNVGFATLEMTKSI